MKITRSRFTQGGENIARRMLRRQPPAPKRPSPVDAPHTNRAGRPSYYPPGQLPVVSTAGAYRRFEGREWEWRYATDVPLDALGHYGLDAADAPAYRIKAPDTFCGEARPARIDLVRRGDWTHWQFDMGQQQQGRRRQWAWVGARWTMLLDGAPQIIASRTEAPVVLQHLDTRPIICPGGYAQAEAECDRVDAEIRR